MATKYPLEIDDSTSIPVGIDRITPVNVTVTNTLRGAIISIENELGSSPSAQFSSVADRLNNLQQQLSNRKITQVIQSNGVTANVTLLPSGHGGGYFFVGPYCKITTQATTGTVSIFVITDQDQVQIVNNLSITSVTQLLLPSINVRSTGSANIIVRFEFLNVTGSPVINIGGTLL
jgi:hypothetical protein